MEYCKTLTLAYFIYKTTFKRHFDDNNFCYDIYLYKANANNLDNIKDKISLFKAS